MKLIEWEPHPSAIMDFMESTKITIEAGEFRQKILAGLAWGLFSQVGGRGLSYVINIVLARLLSPREFGLMAMITVISSFAGIFAEMGFSAAIIQKQNVQNEHLSSVFWLNLIAGLLLMLIFMLTAPLIAYFYGEPSLVVLTMFVSTNFLFGSLGIIQRTLLTKWLNLRRLSIIEVAGALVAGTGAIVLAYNGFGVWSLAIQSVVSSVIVTLLLWQSSSWRPTFTFKWRAIREMLGFSTNFLGTTILNYWGRNIDNLLVGRFFGSAALGVYSRAYGLMLLPITNISRIFSRVMFPSFSMIGEDKLKVKRLYLKMIRATALITFPLVWGLFVTVEPFVLTILGPRWVEVIPILRVLCLVGLTYSIVTFNSNLYLSQNRADLQFRVALLLRFNQILGIIVGLYWGVIGVAIGFTVTSLINVLPSMLIASKLINLSWREVGRSLMPPFVCAVVMASAVGGLGLMLQSLDWPQWGYLLVQVIFGMVLYSTLVHFFNLRGYQELQELLMQQLRRYKGQFFGQKARIIC